MHSFPEGGSKGIQRTHNQILLTGHVVWPLFQKRCWMRKSQSSKILSLSTAVRGRASRLRKRQLNLSNDED